MAAVYAPIKVIITVTNTPPKHSFVNVCVTYTFSYGSDDIETVRKSHFRIKDTVYAEIGGREGLLHLQEHVLKESVRELFNLTTSD